MMGAAIKSHASGESPVATFSRLLADGFWPVAIDPGGKKPLGGKAWGLTRWDADRWQSATRRLPAAGVGLCLGPDRGPGSTWLVDIEGDGPEAEASRLILFGGEVVETMGWGSVRGSHQLFIADVARLTAIMPGLKDFEAKRTPSPGVYHFPALPGLEMRIGGYKLGGEIKQVQSVCPPSIGTDGSPRAWRGPSVAAAVPEGFYTWLAAMNAPKPEPGPSMFAGRAVGDPFGPTITASASADDRWAAAAVAGELAKVEAAGEGGRNDQLFKSTAKLAEVVAGGRGSLTRSGVEAALWDAARRVGLGESEIAATIASGFNSGSNQPRTRPERPTPSIGPRPGPGFDHGTNKTNETGSVGSVGTPPQVRPEFSIPVGDLKVDLLPVSRMGEELIPTILRPWIMDIARRGCFPPEYPAASAVVALSSLVGRNLMVRPKRHDDWTCTPNLWGAIVGPPGMQKTPPVAETFLPIRRMIAEASEAHKQAIEDHNARILVAEARAGEAKKKLAKAIRDESPEATIADLARQAGGDGSGDEPPPLRRFMVNDATVEKLGELLKDNPRGVLQFRDELAGWFKAMDRQGHEGDRSFMLECWDGNGSYTFDRIGRGTIHIEALCLSVFGTIQPGPMAHYLRGAAAGSAADGLMPRFQVLVYPDPPAKFVNIDERPDRGARDAAYDAIKWLEGIKPAEMGAEHDEQRGLFYLRFDHEAQGLFDEWRVELENRLRSGSESPMMAEHLAKYRSLMPSLALIFHLLDQRGDQRLTRIGRGAADLAIAWCHFLESHAQRVYQVAADGDPETAARLGEKIRKGALPDPFTCRVAANKGWSGLDTVESVRKAVGILEDRGWVKVVEVPSGPQGGRASDQVYINPAVGVMKTTKPTKPTCDDDGWEPGRE